MTELLGSWTSHWAIIEMYNKNFQNPEKCCFVSLSQAVSNELSVTAM